MSSFADRIGAAFKALRATPEALDMLSTFGGRYFSYPRSAMVDGAYLEAQSASYAHVYSTQEQVRIVVDAIARSAAKRSLKCYSRSADGTKEEDPDNVSIETLRTPNDFQSQREILSYLIKDKLIYDDAFLWDFGAVEDNKRYLVRVPPYAMGVKSDNKLHPTGYRVMFENGSWLDLAVDEVIHWRGYSPDNNRIGVSPLETLRVMLVESATRKARMIEMIKSGLVKGGIVSRPLDAPGWSQTARDRFQDSFGSRLRDTSIGGVALLEDGMEFQEAGITPREAEMLASRQFELATVANLYGVNPALFLTDGSLAGAREMMDEDVVNPMLADLADTLTNQLVRGTYQDDGHFFRFTAPKITDLGKLFEAGSKATGGSVLTPNEFREDYLDKPPLKTGGDSIVSHPGSQGGGTPPAPGSDPRGRPETPAEDAATEKEVREFMAKSADMRAKAQEAQEVIRKAAEMRRVAYVDEHKSIFTKHFNRQATQQKNGTWPSLNRERWDKELATDLLNAAKSTVQEEGNIVAQSMGSTAFDMGRVENYLISGAKRMAEAVNTSTYADVSKAHEDGAEAVVGVYVAASNGRASVLAETRTTQLMNWAALEAAKQVG